MTVQDIIASALTEDIGVGDFSSLACISTDRIGQAYLLSKDSGILAGLKIAQEVFYQVDNQLVFTPYFVDGQSIQKGDILFKVEGSSISILSAERVALNFMQRMSGIATATHRLATLIAPYHTKLLDTRKTSPNLRLLEKMSVKIGGGENHRFALYDMIMLKDNHIDFAGGIKAAIERTRAYLTHHQLDLKVEIEVRSMEELTQVLSVGQVDRVMLDNFTPALLQEAIALIGGRYETEASGNITEETIVSYAQTGVDYISVGALTHHVRSLDLSLKVQ